MPTEQICPTSTFSLLLQAQLDLFDFDVYVRQLADPHQNAVRNFMVTTADEPAWSFRQKKHADPENERRNHSQTEHPSPALNTGKSVIGQIRNHDADGDWELKKRYNPAARVRRRNFGEINGNVR